MARKKQQQRPDVPRPELQNTSNVDTDVFVKGMTKDMDVALTNKENWTHAVNAINNSHQGDAGTIGNEPANLGCAAIPYTIIGMIHLYGDKWAIFSTDDVNSQIGIFDDSHCKYDIVVNDPCLNFNKRYLITGASKESFECQWWVYWDDGINPSRALNTADVPYIQTSYTEDDGCVIYEDQIPLRLDCEKIRLNPILDVPCIKLSKAKDGGQLQNGSYEAYIAYVVDDNKVTDYYKSNIQTLWDHQDNAGSLDIDIENLDKQFESYQLVIYTNAGMNSYAVVVGTYSTEQSHINIDMIDMSVSTPGLVDQLPLYTPIFEKSEKMYAVNDYLLRQGPTTNFDFNYQCQANNITAKWVSVEYPADYYVKGGNKPTFMRDEQYSFFIRFVYNTGNKSSSYHIPGRAAVGIPANDMGVPPDMNQTLSGEAGFPNWKINNTAFQTMSIDAGGGENIGTYTDDGGLIVAKGWMGYWESTERYPNDPVRWCDLCNTPIRHHKFPEEGTSIWTQRNNPNNQFIYVLGVDFDNIEWPRYIDKDGFDVPIPNIVGYEILVGSRQGNKSIIAKGLARNMRRYDIQNAQGERGIADAEGGDDNLEGLMPNYPFNDLDRDPYLSQQEVIRQSDYVAYGPNYTMHNIFTFHSPDTSFDRPFLSPSEIKSYGVTGGYSLGRFKRSEDHPKHKLIRDIAAIIAAIIGAGYAIMEMRGEKVQKVKGSKALSIGQDPGPYNQSDALKDESTIDTTAGTGTGGVSIAGVYASGGTGTGGTANVDMDVSNDSGLEGTNPAATDDDGITNQDLQNISPTLPPDPSGVDTDTGIETVNGGGAAPGMAGNISITDPGPVGFIPPSIVTQTLTADGATADYQLTYGPSTSQAQLNAYENMQAFNTAQENDAPGTPAGQEGQQGSGGTSSGNLNIISGININDIANGFQPTQESEFSMSTTPIGDATNLILTGGLPNSVSGAEEDFLHDIKSKGDNAAMQTTGYTGSSRDVEMKGSKYKSLPGFLQIMFKTYSFLNFMVEGGEGIIEMIYEFMNPQDYAYKYNSYGMYSGNFIPQMGDRHRIECKRARYLSSAFQNLGPEYKINNLHRPKTVVLQGVENLVSPSSPQYWRDNSKYVLGELPSWVLQNPTQPVTTKISAHYVGLKYRIDNQYGQIQSIRQLPVKCAGIFRNAAFPSSADVNNAEPNETICTTCDEETGLIFDENTRFRSEVIFGGDCFINRYSEKVIMPFFWDFLKGEPDGYTFDYRLHQNVPFVRFWYNSQKYELSGFVRPITDLSFSWLSDPSDPGLPSALHNLDRIGSGNYNAVDEGWLSGTPNNEDDWWMTANSESQSGMFGDGFGGLGGGTGWGSGTDANTTGTTYTDGGPPDTSGDSVSQSTSNWASSGGQATKSNGIFTLKNAYCYLHSSGINEFFVESELNMAQRDWDDKPAGRHYDWQEFTDVNALFHADIIKDGNFYKFDRSLMWRNLGSQLLSYGFVQPLSYDPVVAEECMTHYPKRIMYSLRAQDEAKKDFWRVFLPFNKEDFKEPVTTIKPINKTGAVILFPHRSPQIWQGVDTLQTEGNTKVTIGDGGLFAGPRQNITNSDLPNEYGSCENMLSAINTPAGLFYISQQQGKIFNYTGGLENIADRGMKQWFNNFLPSRLLMEFPEMEGSIDADNPIMGIGTQSVYDAKLDLVYFMKKDYALCDHSGCIQWTEDDGFVYNNTLCNDADQIASCPDGYTLYEAGDVHPGTGEVLTEDTCCNIVRDDYQEFEEATMDCNTTVYVVPEIFNFERLPNDEVLTKHEKNTVLFNVSDDVFENIREKKPMKVKLNIPFIDGRRINLTLKNFEPHRKNTRVLTKSKDGTVERNYVPNIRAYRIRNKEILKNGKEVKATGSIIFSRKAFTGFITIGNQQYEIRRRGQNKYALIHSYDVKESPLFACDTNTSHSIPDSVKLEDLPRTARQLAKSGNSSPDHCINLAVTVDYYTYDFLGQNYQDTSDWAMMLVAAVNEIYMNDLNISITSDFIYIYTDESVDPFADCCGSNQNDMLPVLRDQWDGDEPDFDGVIRSIATLFTARGCGGVAYTGGLCYRNNWGYSVNGFCGNNMPSGTLPIQGQTTEGYDIEDGFVNLTNSLTVKITAHEIGHNVGTLHTHDCVWEPDPVYGFGGFTGDTGQIDIGGNLVYSMFIDNCEDDCDETATADCGSEPIDSSCWPSPWPMPYQENLTNTAFEYTTLMGYNENLAFQGCITYDQLNGILGFHPIVMEQAINPWVDDVQANSGTSWNLFGNQEGETNCLSCADVNGENGGGDDDPIYECDDLQEFLDATINSELGWLVEQGGSGGYTPTQYCNYCDNPVADNINAIEGSLDLCNCCTGGELIVEGCTNPNATNYNPNANVDDGSCEIVGCTDQFATNYNPNANMTCMGETGFIENGCCLYDYSCNNYYLWVDATINSQLGYDWTPSDYCTFCLNQEFYADDPIMTLENATEFCSCCNGEDVEIFGCMDSEANNFNPFATTPCNGTQGEYGPTISIINGTFSGGITIPEGIENVNGDSVPAGYYSPTFYLPPDGWHACKNANFNPIMGQLGEDWPNITTYANSGGGTGGGGVNVETGECWNFVLPASDFFGDDSLPDSGPHGNITPDNYTDWFFDNLGDPGICGGYSSIIANDIINSGISTHAYGDGFMGMAWSPSFREDMPYYVFETGQEYDATWAYEWHREGVGQELSSPMIANVEYTMSVVVANSSGGYILDGYEWEAAGVRIWGGNCACPNDDNGGELLWESEPQSGSSDVPMEWVTRTGTFTPTQNFTHITIEPGNGGETWNGPSTPGNEWNGQTTNGESGIYGAGNDVYIFLDYVSDITPTAILGEDNDCCEYGSEEEEEGGGEETLSCEQIQEDPQGYIDTLINDPIGLNWPPIEFCMFCNGSIQNEEVASIGEVWSACSCLCTEEPRPLPDCDDMWTFINDNINSLGVNYNWTVDNYCTFCLNPSLFGVVQDVEGVLDYCDCPQCENTPYDPSNETIDCECFCPDGYDLVFNDPPTYTLADPEIDCVADVIPLLEMPTVEICDTTLAENATFVTNPGLNVDGGTFGEIGQNKTPSPWIVCMRGSNQEAPGYYPDGFCYDGMVEDGVQYDMTFTTDTWTGQGNALSVDNLDYVMDPFNQYAIDPYEGDAYVGMLHSFSCDGLCSEGCDVGLWQEGMAQALEDADGNPTFLFADQQYVGKFYATQLVGWNTRHRGYIDEEEFLEDGITPNPTFGNFILNNPWTYPLEENYQEQGDFAGSVGSAAGGDAVDAEGNPVSHRITPQIEIWGGTDQCGVQGENGLYLGGEFNYEGNYNSELLWSSGPIMSADNWTEYNYEFTPTNDWAWIHIRVQLLIDGVPAKTDEDTTNGVPARDKATYVVIDGFVAPTEDVKCCTCPEGYQRVLNDGIYQTPISEQECIKEHDADGAYLTYSDEFDVICVKWEPTMNDLVCLQQWSDITGDCVDPQYEDDVDLIELTDEQYFKDVSWTVSYDPKIKGWISFHDWHPELSMPSLNHFLTTNTFEVDDIYCPPGWELNDGICCQNIVGSFEGTEIIEEEDVTIDQNPDEPREEFCPIDIYIALDFSGSNFSVPGFQGSGGSVFNDYFIREFVDTLDMQMDGSISGNMTNATNQIQVGVGAWTSMLPMNLEPLCPWGDSDSAGIINQNVTGLTNNALEIYNTANSMINSQQAMYGIAATTGPGDTYQAAMSVAYNEFNNTVGSSPLGDRSGQNGYQKHLIIVTDVTSISPCNNNCTCCGTGNPYPDQSMDYYLQLAQAEGFTVHVVWSGAPGGQSLQQIIDRTECLLTYSNGQLYQIGVNNINDTDAVAANTQAVAQNIARDLDCTLPPDPIECLCPDDTWTMVYSADGGDTFTLEENPDPTADCEPGRTAVCRKINCYCDDSQVESDLTDIDITTTGECSDIYEVGEEDYVNPNPLFCSYDSEYCTTGSNIRGGLWRHNYRCNLFSNYYDVQYGWEIEMVESVGQTVNTLRSIEYEMEAYLYRRPLDCEGNAICGWTTWDGGTHPIYTPGLDMDQECTMRAHQLDYNFNWAYIYNTEQVSGDLHLTLKPKNNAPEINNYPQTTIDEECNENSFYDILYDKVEQKYRFNQFWDITANRGENIQPAGNFDSGSGPDPVQHIINLHLNGYTRVLNSLNLDYDKPPLQRKKFRHYWNKVTLMRKPIPVTPTSDMTYGETYVYDKDGNPVLLERTKMLLKLDNAKINVSFR